MEMASWDGGISRTVQFLVPKVRSQCPGCAVFSFLFTQPWLNCPFKSLLASKSAFKEARIQRVYTRPDKRHTGLCGQNTLGGGERGAAVVPGSSVSILPSLMFTLR